MLAQFALISFALCGMVALAVDLGFVRLTQVEMQTAADTAALEGLRQRDVGVIDAVTGLPVENTFAADCMRRAAAHRLVRVVFDDDLGQTAEPDVYGAGPIVDLTTGVTNMHALQTISVPAVHVYDPDLQMNQQNQVYGDMVSGEFCYNADPAPSEGVEHDAPNIVCSALQRGSGAYARNDFNPSAAPPQPPAALPECPAADDPPPDRWPGPSSGSLTTPDHSAFLVRLRRSNEMADQPGQTEAGVATSGPTLPLLFGRATTIAGDDATDAYSVRRDGFTVRATAISQVRPALRVGLPGNGQRGVIPFALNAVFVRTVNANGTAVTLNPATGVICSGTTCVGANPPTAVGRFVDALTDPTRVRWRAIATVGLPLPAATAVTCAAAGVGFSGFGPVYSLLASGTNRIVGFTRINLVRDPARPADPCAARVTHGVSLIASANATASLMGGLPLPVTAGDAEVREVLDKNLERQGVVYAPVLVPVLAR